MAPCIYEYECHYDFNVEMKANYINSLKIMSYTSFYLLKHHPYKEARVTKK